MAKKADQGDRGRLRDAHRLWPPVTMDEMRPILPEMDKINYFSV